MNSPFGRSKQAWIDGWDLLIGMGMVLVTSWLLMHWAVVQLHMPSAKWTDWIMAVLERVENEPLSLSWSDPVWRLVGQAHLKLSPFYVVGILLYLTRRTHRDYARMEHGSAGWASSQEKKAFGYGPNRIVLSKELFLDLETKQVNLNQLVIGGSGAGKSRSKIIPDLLQANSSFVVTDPKGELYRTCAGVLEDEGYRVRVLHLIDPSLSHRYNPFHYLREDKDVLILVDTIMKNTSDPRKSGGDEFWTKSETALLQAIVFYLWHERPLDEQHLAGVLAIVTSARINEEQPDGSENPLEQIFDELAIRNPNHIAVRCYNVFRLATGKTAKSILISLAVRLSIFQTDDIAHLTSTDEMDLARIGTEKTAVFLILSDSHGAFNVIAALFYSQMFQFLFYEADHRHGGRLPVPVQALLDEFANIGQIPDFDQLIATMRSRRVSVTVVLQSLSQLKNRYRDSWETIVGCCDTLVYLGTQDQETRQYISRMLGKTTIVVDGKSRTKSSRSHSSSESEQRTARELMSADELLRMDRNNSIVFVRGYRPFWTEKYDLVKHPSYARIREPVALERRSKEKLSIFLPANLERKGYETAFDQAQIAETIQLQQAYRQAMEVDVQRQLQVQIEQHVSITDPDFKPVVTMMVDPLGEMESTDSLSDMEREIEQLLRK
jgi:type IV secretion system protein VirD4